AIDFFFRFVVVAELDENVIARAQLIDNGLPSSLGNERPGASSVLRAVFNDYFVGLKKFSEHFPPAGFRSLLRWFLRHRRIAREINCQRSVLCMDESLTGKSAEQKQNRELDFHTSVTSFPLIRTLRSSNPSTFFTMFSFATLSKVQSSKRTL